MPGSTADVVIIGGGAIGAATAFHLARNGITDVVVIERDTLASGSTSKSAGGIRLQFADELNIRIMLRSLPEFETFTDLIGSFAEAPDIAFRQVGYLFLLTQDDDVAAFAAAAALQRSLGIDTRELTGAEAGELVSGLITDDVRLATICAREGHCSPEAVVFGYAAAARALGVRVSQQTSVVGLERRGDEVIAVDTTAGRIAAGRVVCAAGAWTADIGRMAGVEIPITAERRHMWFTPESCGLADDMPMTIDFATSFYAHREGPGLVFGGREDDLADVGARATARLPMIADAPIASTWSGLYEMSPDHNAIVGEVPGAEGLLVASGFSGHGFQQAPAIGEHVAQLISGVPPTLDLSAMSPARFADRVPRPERFVV